MANHNRTKHSYTYAAAASAAVAGMMLSGCTSGQDSETALKTGGAGVVVVADHYREGRAHFFAGRYGLAANEFQTSLLLEGGQAETYNALGATYDKLARFDLAQRYYKRALALNPASSQYLNNYGYSLFLQGKRQEAVRFFSRARRQDASNPVIEANLRRALKVEEPVRKELASATAPLDRPADAAPPRKVWLEKTSRNVHTLISKPKPAVVAKTARSGMDPSFAHFAAAAAAQKPAVVEKIAAAPPAAETAGGAFDVRAEWGLVMPAPRPRVQLANVQTVAEPNGPERTLAAIRGYTFAIANGTGRRHMASRMRGFLQQGGWRRARLQNADHYSYRQSIISAKQGYEQAARDLKAKLPGNPMVTKAPATQAVAIRLILGADLLGFDARLIEEANRG